MILTPSDKKHIARFASTQTYDVIEKIARNIIERSWKMRKAGATADETLKTISFAEGMEQGALEVLNMINKLSQ